MMFNGSQDKRCSSSIFLLNWCLSVIHKPARICLPWCILHISHRSGDLYSESRKPRGSTGISTGQTYGWNDFGQIEPTSLKNVIQCGSSKDVHCLCLKLWNWQTLADRYPAWGAMGAIAMGACGTATRGVAGMPSSKKKRACQVSQLDVQWFSVVKLQGIHMHIINTRMYHMQIYSPKYAWYCLM